MRIAEALVFVRVQTFEACWIEGGGKDGVRDSGPRRCFVAALTIAMSTPPAAPADDLSIHRPALNALPEAARKSTRRGSGVIATPSGDTHYYTSTDAHETLPHPKAASLADVQRKYESLFIMTPQRMRIIVDAFEEALEKGLQEPGQVVVRSSAYRPTVLVLNHFRPRQRKWSPHLCLAGRRERSKVTSWR